MLDTFYCLAEGHYWDSFEKDRETILKHIKFLVDETKRCCGVEGEFKKND